MDGAERRQMGIGAAAGRAGRHRANATGDRIGSLKHGKDSVAIDSQGAAWLATDKGIAKIEERSMTLADKAAHCEQITLKRHNRRGYVTRCNLNTPGDPEGGFTHEASDNDGLWTAMYIGAE